MWCKLFYSCLATTVSKANSPKDEERINSSWINCSVTLDAIELYLLYSLTLLWGQFGHHHHLLASNEAKAALPSFAMHFTLCPKSPWAMLRPCLLHWRTWTCRKGASNSQHCKSIAKFRHFLSHAVDISVSMCSMCTLWGAEHPACGWQLWRALFVVQHSTRGTRNRREYEVNVSNQQERLKKSSHICHQET